jgi:hypothetical protein
MSLLVLRLLAREEELDAEHRSATNRCVRSNLSDIIGEEEGRGA